MFFARAPSEGSSTPSADASFPSAGQVAPASLPEIATHPPKRQKETAHRKSPRGVQKRAGDFRQGPIGSTSHRQHVECRPTSHLVASACRKSSIYVGSRDPSPCRGCLRTHRHVLRLLGPVEAWRAGRVLRSSGALGCSPLSPDELAQVLARSCRDVIAGRKNRPWRLFVRGDRSLTTAESRCKRRAARGRGRAKPHHLATNGVRSDDACRATAGCLVSTPPPRRAYAIAGELIGRRRGPEPEYPSSLPSRRRAAQSPP